MDLNIGQLNYTIKLYIIKALLRIIFILFKNYTELFRTADLQNLIEIWINILFFPLE